MDATHRIEVVRGRLTDERTDEILSFWAAHGVLGADLAKARLDDLVCLVVDDAGQVVGTSSARREQLALVGRRWFWVHRRFVAPGVPTEVDQELLAAAFEALEAEVRDGDDAPIGVCMRVEEQEVMLHHPEAVWPDNGFLYAGYLPDGRQLRIRYFDGALVV